MINLKLSGLREENLTIEKNNNIIILNYEKYIEFYKHFYEKNDLFIENKEVTKKDCVFIDITSIGLIMKELEFKKNTLLYDYILIKYNDINIDDKDKFYNSYLEQIEVLKDNLNLDVDLIPEQTIDKVVMQYLDVGLNYNNLISEFKTIIEFIINYNLNKTYIVFYDSRFFELNLNINNCYTFDINPFLDSKRYNLLITNEINELNYETLVNYLKNVWPTDYYNQEIETLLEEYIKCDIYKRSFTTKKEKMYLLASILNKEYKINQKITCDKVIFDSIIKSFIDKL